MCFEKVSSFEVRTINTRMLMYYSAVCTTDIVYEVKVAQQSW